MTSVAKKNAAVHDIAERRGQPEKLDCFGDLDIGGDCGKSDPDKQAGFAKPFVKEKNNDKANDRKTDPQNLVKQEQVLPF